MLFQSPVFVSGCSIPVVRVHGVDVDRVRFPAARLLECVVNTFFVSEKLCMKNNRKNAVN